MIDAMMMNNTLLCRDRLSVLGDAMTRLSDVDADICEIGVYKGGSARFLCKNTSRTVYLIDTFDGLPAPCSNDAHRLGDFNDTSVEYVKSVLGECVNYEIIKQHFPRGDTSNMDNKMFKVVHIDVDLYSCVKECLEYFYPKMIHGGVIVLDDYNAPTCLGAKKAVDEFISDKPEKVMIGASCSVIIVKE
jgi:O-methyltransferase